MAKRPIGRPSSYTQEIAEAVCRELATGKSLRTVCLADDMPGLSTIFKWFREHPEFVEQYARAKQESADAMAEEILDIADNGTNDWMDVQRGGKTERVTDNEALQRSRLRVDTRKWLMSKMKPKRYGEKLDMTTNGKDLPVPLLHAIRNNDSDQKDSSAEEAH